MNNLSLTTTNKSRARGRKSRSIKRRQPSSGESKRSGHPKVTGPRTIVVPISVTPDRTICQLRYTEPAYTTGTLSGGGHTVEKYRINSVYDPYVGVGGGQPSGFAQMFAKYEFCRVWKARIHVRIARNEHQSDYPYDMALVPLSYSGSLSPPTTFATYAEQPYAIVKKGVSVYADQPHSLIQTISVPAINGVTPIEFAGNGGFYHANGTNPIYDTQWHLVLSQQIVGVDNTELVVSVDIVYDCEFFMRLATPASFLDDAVTAHKEKLLLMAKDGKDSKDTAKDEGVLVTSIGEEIAVETTTTTSSKSSILPMKLPVVPARSTTRGVLTLRR